MQLQQTTQTVSGTKGLYIQTYGCQMNVYDSQSMVELLRPHGFTLVEDIKDAAMVILNTCHIRHNASQKVYSKLRNIAALKRKKRSIGQEMVIVVAGCVAQAEGEEVIKQAPYVDIVVGPQSYHNLPHLLEKIRREKSWAIDLDFAENEKFDKLPIPPAEGGSAFLSIQEGCDKFCHFCVVPYTRGAEFSRSVSEIYRQALQLASQGTIEINLLGQNVNAFHGQGPDQKEWNLGQLLRHLAQIPGIQRLRYTTSHPMDMLEQEELFIAHAEEAKVMPFIHLPIQSGSDKILKAMNRKHSTETYLAIIDKFRKYCPQIAFSSDFIVGYPGETEDDFQQTMNIVRQVGYAQAYSFKYSPRPGTPAATLPQIDEDVKIRRLAELQSLILDKQLEFNKQFIGQKVPVLLSKTGKKQGQLIGKSPYLQSVVIDAKDVSTSGDEEGIDSLFKARNSEIIDVEITAAGPNSLLSSGTNR